MSGTAGRLHLPFVKDGPLGGAPRRSGEPIDDWSEIEALLALPALSHVAAVAPPPRRRHTAPVIVSSLVATAAFGGILSAWWSLQRGCDAGAVGCAMTVTPAVAVAPARTTPTNRVADAGASRSDGRALPPLVEGRSVSEVSAPSEVPAKSAAVEPAPVAAKPAISTPPATPSPEASRVSAGDAEAESSPAPSVTPQPDDRLRHMTAH